MAADTYVPRSAKEYHPVQAMQWTVEGEDNTEEVRRFISRAGYYAAVTYKDGNLRGMTYMKVFWPSGTSAYKSSGLYGKDATMMFPGDWAVIYLGNRIVIVPDADFRSKWKKAED